MKLQEIVSTYLGLIDIEAGTAVCIASAVKNLLSDVKLPTKYLIGVGVDNASVNMGLNNGVCEILQKELGLLNLIMV